MDNNTLQHHGIKGQRWGIRRFQNRDGSLTSSGKKRRADDSDTDENKQKQEPVKKKKVKDMTDEEIREKMDRLQLEKQYKALMNEVNPPPSHEGRKFVANVLKKSGENIGVQLTTYVMGATVNKVAKDVLHIKNSTVTLKDKDGKPIINPDGLEAVQEMFEAIVNPRKGQKDK
jgi:hypothetical protein